MTRQALAKLGLLAGLALSCGEPGPHQDGRSWECVVSPGADPDYASEVGCLADFDALASDPLVANIPGAQSVKTEIDQRDGDALYFQNSTRYAIHWDFASAHLSGNGLPIVPDWGSFNTTEYYSPDRRFLLGAVTYYEGPDVFAYEVAPYDTATADMIAKAFRIVSRNAYFGNALKFHPTSDAIERVAAELPPSIPIVTTDELYAGIDYQPLNLGESYGLLRFVSAEDLETDYVGFRDIVVLDTVPFDISVTAGLITQDFQTPLSHVNVLSQNRGTPNMALRGAFSDPALRGLEGKWVRLVVEAQQWSIEETTRAEAEAWWEDHRPEPLGIPALDLTVTDLRDIEEVLDVEGLGLAEALHVAIPAFGGKASHLGGVVLIGDDVPHPEAFAVPVYYYRQFMEDNELDVLVEALVASEAVQDDPAVRASELEALRAAIETTEVGDEFLTLLADKIEQKWPDLPRVKLRSSTNSEDLGDFTGAGLYESHAGDIDDPLYPLEDAVRKTWSSIWTFRAYEEREYRGIDHTAVGMAMLVNPSFTDEEANGVAVTANLFDTGGLEPGFYVNVQRGEVSVVQPVGGETSDEFIYYFYQPGQPLVFVSHSSLVPDDETVLTREDTYDLGTALDAIHQYFLEAYGPTDEEPDRFYAMDVEFKFDDMGTGDAPSLWVKQARPYPGRGD